MGNPFLSIIIPTYNRCEILLENLKGLLQYQNDDIEIVIHDDNSTEPIENAIKELGDNRIAYYKNKTNLGIDNFFYSLKAGKGTYLWITSYRDTIKPENIRYVKEILYEKNPDLCALSGENTSQYPELDVRGIKAIDKFYGQLMWGTGIIYRKDKIEFDKYNLTNGGYEIWNQYPQTFLANDIARKGRCLYISRYCFKRTNYPTTEKQSWYIEDKPYYPEISARQHLQMCMKEKIQGIEKSFYAFLLARLYTGWLRTYLIFLEELKSNERLGIESKEKIFKKFLLQNFFTLYMEPLKRLKYVRMNFGFSYFHIILSSNCRLQFIKLGYSFLQYHKELFIKYRAIRKLIRTEWI